LGDIWTKLGAFFAKRLVTLPIDFDGANPQTPNKRAPFKRILIFLAINKSLQNQPFYLFI
jgi:hypothetical protein